jgi:hypothetical protein
MNAVGSLTDDDFTPLRQTDEIPTDIFLSSKGWYEQVLRRDANPYLPANGAHHSFVPSDKATPDLLRHEFEYQGKKIVIVESRNFIMLTIKDCIEIEERQKELNQVSAWAQGILRAEGQGYRLEFRRVSDGSGHEYYSTNPNVNVVFLRVWHDRVDAFVRNTSLSFLCYKRVEQRVGFQDDQKWFDDNFRRKGLARKKQVR